VLDLSLHVLMQLLRPRRRCIRVRHRRRLIQSDYERGSTSQSETMEGIVYTSTIGTELMYCLSSNNPDTVIVFNDRGSGTKIRP
jgi:hypothetical protein